MASGDKKKSSKSSAEDIVRGFNELRTQQRQLIGKISEIEQDLKDHELVSESLKGVDGDRKCFRLVGGVLVERTVKDVLPALLSNKEQLSKLVEALTKQMEMKGKEINEYREKHSIRVRGEDDGQKEAARSKPATASSSGGVLVAKES